MASRIVAVTGASGAGKTTVVTRLAERKLAGVTCAFFDSVGVPPPEEMPFDIGHGDRGLPPRTT
jgi:ABC-type thiamine transport system ATPase subunit